MEENLQVENSFSSTPQINSYLIEASKWGLFLAIVGYIGLGLMLIAGIVMSITFSGLSGLTDNPMPVPMGMFSFIYIIIAAIYFFPIYYLHQFSLKIKDGLRYNDQNYVALGFKNLKSLFKFMGITTIIIMSLYILAIAMVLITGAFVGGAFM